MSSFAKDVNDYASKYDRFKVHSLEGLNDFLKPVQHCFIHMTNFGGVDLPSLNVPSIQMKTKLAVCVNNNKIHAISSSLDLHKNKTFGKYCNIIKRLPCPLSPLFADSYRLCVRINFRKFVINTRPWTCEVVISLFQKQAAISRISRQRNSFSVRIQTQNNVIPFEENHYSVVRYIERQFPSFAPINILMTDNLDVSARPQNWEFPNNFGVWFKYSLMEKFRTNTFDSHRISRDTYFVVLTTPISLKDHLHTIDYLVFKINSVFSLQIIPVFKTHEIHCLSSANIFMKRNDLLMMQKYSAVTKVFDATSIYEYNLISIGEISTMENFIYEYICNSMYLKWATTSLHAFGEVYSISIMGEWLQILRRYNYTIFIAGEKVICKLKHHTLEATEYLGVQASSTLVQSHNKVYPTSISHPLAIDDPNHMLGFMSCGTRSIDYLAFRELFRVFDVYVWMCLCIIYFAVVPIALSTMEWLSEKNKLSPTKQHASQQNVFTSRIFLQPMIILLEQGSAFTNKHLNVAAIRWVASAVILVAIVLSNSYKYDNVYNMMLPRKATPLWYFQQLLSANFTVYTRTNFGSLFPQNLLIGYQETSSLYDIKQSDHTITFMDEDSNTVRTRSEVQSIVEFELVLLYLLRSTLLTSWDEKKMTSKPSGKHISFELGETLKFNTKLHPYETKLVKRRRLKYVDIEQYENDKKAYDKGQTYYISQLLNECDNTAIVLPFSNIRRLLSIIQKQGNAKLSVGKEILFERRIGLALNGWISDHLITTLSRIHDVGLWQHIHNIFVRNMTTTIDSSRDFNYQTSQISGNILVVFVTFLCGHGVAAVSFIFEIRKRIYGWTLVLAESVYLGRRRLWIQTKLKWHRIKCWLPTWPTIIDPL
ncbi:unnamed protein product [Orchesella dallaii]|uniref:Uncharacterized protein n=1 Tax=Orchesella dallaii TaxID=48710 RepID=A0ABP1S808_9HEXA